MKEKPTTVDEYLLQLPAFAQPVLVHFRKLVHQACPQVEEQLKWGHPSFEYKGIMCVFAGFRQYCAISFWKTALIRQSEQVLKEIGDTSIGRLDKIISLKDLPADNILKAWIREAMRLNEENIRLPAAKKAPPKELTVPEDLMKALKQNKTALAIFEKFSPTNKREYVAWLEDAKTQATRDKRLATALEWIAEGKSRHWKYARK